MIDFIMESRNQRRPTGTCGIFRQSIDRRVIYDEFEIKDMVNDINFYRLIDCDDNLQLVNWLQTNCFVAQTKKCDRCDESMYLRKRNCVPDGYSWECTNRHQSTIRNCTFFFLTLNSVFKTY